MNGTKKTGPGTTIPAKTGRPAVSEAHEAASQEYITQRLRELYDTVQEEGTPDRFLDLLEQLDEAEKAASEKPGK
ncbi:NepR family anti-sigma factor [Stappia sp. WLB 29]|uniref:NepR family anti-sigma factor n=1 Tax=Stappia sp. WLB 29 TaxID=2925220 RepID=UPI0020C07B91|nr:NepR family anti-sigma factor [Stappia sp. WLB 29]